jgi:hypothetical protein
MAWGTKTAATQLTSITTEVFFDVTPTLGTEERAVVQVTVDFPTTPTDHALISVYATPDASSPVYDNNPFMGPFLVPNSPDPALKTFVVSGCYRFRVGVKRSGTTNTLTSADMNVLLNGVNP